jgi:hypothetical protein
MKARIFSFAAIAAMCAMPVVTNADDKTVGERVDKAIDKAGHAVKGDESKENDDLGDVRGSLITIVNRVLTKDGLDDAVSYLANQDRDRINNQSKDYEDRLNGLVDQFRGMFKQKYGEDFDLRIGSLDTATAIQQGEVKDAATARSHWPLPAMGDKGMSRNVASNNNDDPKFENGRDIAVVRLAGKEQGDALTLSLQHELPDYWVVDVSNTVTADGIIQSQTKVLTGLIEKQDSWPKTKEEAYRLVAHKILHGFVMDNAKDPVVETPRD